MLQPSRKQWPEADSVRQQMRATPDYDGVPLSTFTLPPG